MKGFEVKRMGSTVVWTGLLSLLLLLGGTGMVADTALAQEAADEGNELDFPELNVTEERMTNVLGGGNFIGIHNKDNDAMIGILYGTPENPNYVYVISVFTRYLGVADIYGEKGAELAKDRPIPVRTLYAQKFDTIYEFSDTDDDGIWDSRRLADEGSGNGQRQEQTSSERSEENLTMEPVFSKASLRTGWTASRVHKQNNGNGSVEWSVKLTAKDLPYRGPIFGVQQRRGVLEKVELTFHLFVEKRNVTRDDVPAYRVDVAGGKVLGYRVTDTERVGARTFNGSSVSASVKYDHLIAGWDFFPRNSNPNLMMSTELLFLNGLSPRVSEFLRNMREENFEGNGTVDYETSSGQQRVRARNAIKLSGDDPIVAQSSVKPQLVRKNRLGIADNWQKVGNLKWASNVTVDDVEDTMYFQVYFARAFAGVNANGAIYAGIGIVGGFSYPDGKRIFHDPTYEVSSFEVRSDDDENGVKWQRVIVIGVLVFAGVALVVVLGISGLIVAARSDKMGPGKKKEEEDHYDGYYMSKGRS